MKSPEKLHRQGFLKKRWVDLHSKKLGRQNINGPVTWSRRTASDTMGDDHSGGVPCDQRGRRVWCGSVHGWISEGKLLFVRKEVRFCSTRLCTIMHNYAQPCSTNFYVLIVFFLIVRWNAIEKPQPKKYPCPLSDLAGVQICNNRPSVLGGVTLFASWEWRKVGSLTAHPPMPNSFFASFRC